MIWEWFVTTPKPNLTWQNTLGGQPKGPKNPSKIKLSTYFHLSPEKPTYLLLWLTPRILGSGPLLCIPGLDEEIAQSSLINFTDGDESLKQKSNDFNKLDFKKNNGNYQEATQKTFILG